MRPAILLFTDGETEAWSWTCSRVVFIGKNTMQDFAQSSQNCNHWVLLLVRAIVLPRVIGEEPGGTNRPYWPHPVPPWTSPHPYPWPRTPFQLSLVSLSGTTRVPVSGQAFWMYLLYAPSLQLVYSCAPGLILFCTSWASWMAPGPGSSPAMLGAVGGPRYQLPDLHLGSAPEEWCPECPNKRLDKDPTESPRNAQLSSYPDTEVK